MVSINFQLLSSKQVNERTVYSLLQLFGDIGGLLDFVMLIMTPLVGFIVGDRFTYIILKSLYMQNRHESDKVYSDFHQSVKNPTNKRLRQKAWLDETIPYKESTKNTILMNQLVSTFFTCRDCKKTCLWKCKKTTAEKIYNRGQSRIEKALDVRNLIKS